MFVGREDLLDQLNALWRAPVASLVTCRGRRRIGKSTLIAEFARRSRVKFLKLEGLPPHDGVDNAKQLESFARQLAEQTSKDYQPLTNWFDAFARLDDSLSAKAKTVVLLDEISWMGKFDPSFPSELKYAWDNRFAKKAKLIVVLCGSVSSWIDTHILKNKGFVGRPSLNLVVPELTMKESYEFWRQGARGSQLATRDIIDILSVTGGVPKYLERIDPMATADENIERLCFRAGGLLVDEFEDIFDDALDEGLSVRKKLLMAMMSGAQSVSELADAVDIGLNGRVSDHLDALEQSGFVAKDEGLNPLSGKKTKELHYRICDNYTRFYLKYIEPLRMLIKKGSFRFATLEQLPGWHAVMGLQFENLVCNNVREILRQIGLGRTLPLSAAPFRQNKTARSEACQIDLLLQTKHTHYLVEIKRRENLGEEIVGEVQDRAHKLKVKRGVSVIPILVYEGHLSKRVPADGYFARVISAEDLIGRES